MPVPNFPNLISSNCTCPTKAGESKFSCFKTRVHILYALRVNSFISTYVMKRGHRVDFIYCLYCYLTYFSTKKSQSVREDMIYTTSSRIGRYVAHVIEEDRDYGSNKKGNCYATTTCYPGSVSASDKMSYCKISQSRKAARFVFIIVRSPWNLTGTSAAGLPIRLSISKRCGDLNYQSRGFDASRDLMLT